MCNRPMKFSFAFVLALALGAVAFAPAAHAQSAPSSSSVSGAAQTEDFSTLALPSQGLLALPPELVDKDEEEDYTQDVVRVMWREGDPIYLYVTRPANVSKPPVVIYLYGYPGESDIFSDDDWCRNTTRGGYASVGFVPYLTGQRYHDVPMKEWFVSQMRRSLVATTHDVQMVLNYLAERGDVDVNNAGVFGVGVGGTIAALAASADSRIKGIELVDPWGDWPVWLAKSKLVPDNERADYLKPEFLNRIAPFDPVVVLPALKTPHISIHQRNDDVVTPEDAKRRVEEALPATAERRRFQNAAEFNAALAADGHHAYDWLKQQLKSASVKTAGENSDQARPDLGSAGQGRVVRAGQAAE